MRATSFIVFVVCLVPALVVVDPAIGNAFAATFGNITSILSAHPFDAVALGTAFVVDPLDITYTLAEWRALRRVSASTERRMRAAGLGPRLVFLSRGRLGVTRKDDLAWMEAGGASGASASNPDPPTGRRNTGRNTGPATAASLKKRAERKLTGPSQAITAPASGTDSSPQQMADSPGNEVKKIPSSPPPPPQHANTASSV